MEINELTFADPLWLLALLALPLVAWARRRRAVDAIVMPSAGAWQRSVLASGSRLPQLAAYLGAALLIIALARPQRIEEERQTKNKGYDIMLALDLSGSMLYEDYEMGAERINRLNAVKPVVSAFVSRRENDRIGLVTFAGRAYTVAPLTFDHDWLARQTDRLVTGLIEDGTAIGDALGVAVSRLQEGRKERAGDREGSFIVLLTDGENNSGALDPMTATELAAEEGIRVFTIGAGRNGWVTAPEFNSKGVRIGSQMVLSRFDEATLKEIARRTGGRYFRAGDSDTIEEAFETIDRESKIEFEVNQYSFTTELFPYPATAAAALLVFAALASLGVRKEALA